MTSEHNHEHDDHQKELRGENPPSQASQVDSDSSEPVTGTYYADDDHSTSGSSSSNATSSDWDDPKNFAESVCDSIIRKVPFQVMFHLNNSHKELLKAWNAFGDSQLVKADQFMNRVRDIHHKKGE